MTDVATPTDDSAEAQPSIAATVTIPNVTYAATSTTTTAPIILPLMIPQNGTVTIPGTTTAVSDNLAVTVTPPPNSHAVGRAVADLLRSQADEGDGEVVQPENVNVLVEALRAARAKHPTGLNPQGVEMASEILEMDGVPGEAIQMGPDGMTPIQTPCVDCADETLAPNPKSHPFLDKEGDGVCDICGKPEDAHRAAKKASGASEALVEEMLEAMTVAMNDAPPPPDAPQGELITIDPSNPGRFRAILVVEDERTSDNRMIAQGATSWREPPLPLMLMTRTAEGHDGAEVAAVMETIVRDGSIIRAEGRFDTGTAGVEAARLVANKILTGVSIDAGDVEGEVVVEEEDADGNPTKILAKMTSLTIGMATIVPFPAIGSTFIEWIAPDANAAEEEDSLAASALANVVSITAGAPIAFPTEMFSDPGFTGLTPITVTADGRVFGHAAPWGTCHIGLPGVCTTAPRSNSGYSHFLTGALPLSEGGVQPVGTISLHTSHANDRLGPTETLMHYDHTGSAVAYVNCGEDAYGIWISGVLKPGISDELATELCGSSLSGDWRNIGGHLELVAILGVNVPGFPVAHTRNGVQTALVAAGYGPTKRVAHDDWRAAVAMLDRLNVEKWTARDERLTALETELAETKFALARSTAQVAPLLREHLTRRLAPSGS